MQNIFVKNTFGNAKSVLIAYTDVMVRGRKSGSVCRKTYFTVTFTALLDGQTTIISRHLSSDLELDQSEPVSQVDTSPGQQSIKFPV